MTRKEFIAICGTLGISLPFQSLLSCTPANDNTSQANFNGKVLIVGAGAAGLTAGYLLHQKGIDFQILEAAPIYGGRMKSSTNFVDFPIPLGAEWLHVERGIFNEAVNDPSIEINIETTPYNPNEDTALFEGQQVSMADLGFSVDQKFINATWFDFFEAYITPVTRDNIKFNEIVSAIDYSKDKIVIQTQNGTFDADKVILTAPVKMLKNGTITFTPELPENKLSAINNVTVWDGFKAFIEFSEKFYPTAVGFDIRPETSGQKLYYDAAYGQRSNQHVLGLFTVGSGTLPYRELSDSDLIDAILAELDTMFDGKASNHYIKHISQNWTNEPFANGAYVYDHENWRTIRTLGESVNTKLFFAGTAYTTGDDWGSVHTAIRSALRAVNEISTS